MNTGWETTIDWFNQNDQDNIPHKINLLSICVFKDPGTGLFSLNKSPTLNDVRTNLTSRFLQNLLIATLIM